MNHCLPPTHPGVIEEEYSAPRDAWVNDRGKWAYFRAQWYTLHAAGEALAG